MLDELQIADYALDGRTHVIEVEGQIDLYTAPALKQRTTRVVDEGKAWLIVDLSRVTFMDSMGLGVLIGASKRLRAVGTDLVLVVTDPDVESLFELTGLDGVFGIFPTRDAALQHLEATRGA